MKFLPVISLLLSTIGCIAQPWKNDELATRDSITLFFIGDIMQHAPQITGAWNPANQEHDYKHCFQYIQPYWEKADYVIANLKLLWIIKISAVILNFVLPGNWPGI